MFISRAVIRKTRTATTSVTPMNSQTGLPRCAGAAGDVGAGEGWSVMREVLPLESRAVPDALMAMDAADRVLGRRAAGHDVVNEIAMAAQAVVLRDQQVGG